MKLAIYESTGQDKHKNQILGNVSYEQNMMSIFWKKLQQENGTR